MLEVIAICGRCRKPVEPGDGSISVSWADIRHARAARYRAMKLLLSAGMLRLDVAETFQDFMEVRAAAEWMVRHDRCYQFRAPRYGFGVADVRTRRDLMAMSCHLAKKPWIFETDWDHVLRDAVKLRGRRLYLWPSREELDATARRYGFENFAAARN